MFKNWVKLNKSIVIFCVCLMIIIILFPIVTSGNIDNINGFDKGPSNKSVVALKKVTLVQFDEEKLIDDYAYLASVPTAAFCYDGRLFSHPLLFYQEEHEYEDEKEKSLNARQGLNYFMNDWMGYCYGQLDQMTTINIGKKRIEPEWKARNYTIINNNDIFNLAGEIALKEWTYSNEAVIAVIQPEYNKPDDITKGSIHGTLNSYHIKSENFKVDLPDIGTSGTWTSFEIKDNQYKYISMELSWPYRVLDYDLQLYDTQLGQVDNAMRDYKEHLMEGTNEIVGSFIHNYGTWRISVTAVPKKGMIPTEDDIRGESIIATGINQLANTINKKADVNIKFYPGTIIDLPATPFGCRDIDFTLKWKDPGIKLGFTIIDPAGTEICSSLSVDEVISGNIEKNNGEVNVNLDLIGETRPNENYSLCVFSLDDLRTPLDFSFEHSWKQKFNKREAEGLASASNGAVLASKLNSPLLYVKSEKLPEKIKDVLYTLGVNSIHLVNIGNHLQNEVKNELKDIADVMEYNEAKDIYDSIKKDIEENDVVFTTIDPWTYWYIGELKPAGEHPGALFIGPAAFIAAHHETPVLIVDLHPRLSQAITYPTQFWGSPNFNQHIDIPNSGNMALSSRQVYDFLEDYNLGKLEEGLAEAQDQETIITVAGQYDIGIPWDRSFTGAALNGRFMFSPVDTAYWICRNLFYPALIFQNPGAAGKVKLINGSESKVSHLPGARLRTPVGVNLVITKPSEEEEFEFPVLQTYADFIHRFNEKASKHWDFTYERADGHIPYHEYSPDPIDDGVVPDKSGAYYPDLYETYVIPFYCKKAEYSNVYSSNFKATVENLNRGVLQWMVCCHGGHISSGMISLWDSTSPYVYEENPWRVYETPLVYPGNLREFFRWVIYLVMGKQPSKLTDGFIRFHLFSHVGSTENPDVLHINPQLRIINKILYRIGSPIDFWGATGVMVYRDRILHPLKTIKKGLPFTNIYQGDGKVIISPRSGSEYLKDWKTGYDFDNALENLHSCSINAISCLPAGTYLHMTWMRHGTVYQIIDPWTTTDWSAVWEQMLIKRFAMGDSVGQAYEKGMRAVGPEYTVGQFWWDRYQNVELFGDPDLRVLVPGTQYSDKNNWDINDVRPLNYEKDLSLKGHTPFGATGHPNAKIQKTFIDKYMWLIGIIVLIIILLFAIAIIGRKKK